MNIQRTDFQQKNSTSFGKVKFYQRSIGKAASFDLQQSLEKATPSLEQLAEGLLLRVRGHFSAEREHSGIEIEFLPSESRLKNFVWSIGQWFKNLGMDTNPDVLQNFRVKKGVDPDVVTKAIEGSKARFIEEQR